MLTRQHVSHTAHFGPVFGPKGLVCRNSTVVRHALSNVAASERRRHLQRSKVVCRQGSDDKEWCGIPFGSVWPWQFRTEHKDLAEPRYPWLLMAIKLAHYFTLVAHGTLSYMLFAAQPFLMSGAWKLAETVSQVTCVKVSLTQLEAFLLVLGSVYQAAAGGFFIMAHEYDGWEIGRFAWPDDKAFVVTDDTAASPGNKQPVPMRAKNDIKEITYKPVNNDRLRLVAYQMLWMFQGLGMGIAAFALTSALTRAQQAGAALPWLTSPFVTAMQSTTNALQRAAEYLPQLVVPEALVPAALLVFWFVATPWQPNTSMQFQPNRDALRTPLASAVVSAVFGLWFAASLWPLLGGTAGWAVACFIVGGMTEAIGAEGFTNQWAHLAAVTIISVGSLLLILGIHCVTTAVTLPKGSCPVAVPLPWASLAVRSWFGYLGVAALALMAAAALDGQHHEK